MKKFSTNRIYLREISEEDLSDRVMKWFDDPNLMRYYTNSGNKITKEGLLNSIKLGHINQDNFTYGIFDIKNDLMIGTMRIGPINKRHKISDLSTLIGDYNYLGKGYSTEIIKLGNDIAFNNHDIRKLYGGMYMSNTPSIKAYRKAGWMAEGRLKGFYLNENGNEDRILVTCFNPKYFSDNEINEIKRNEHKFL